MEKPSIIQPLGTLHVRQKKTFRFSVKSHFAPHDGSLLFHVKHAPTWVSIDEETGDLEGLAPEVSHDTSYVAEIEAHNRQGSVVQTLFIKVICTDIIKSTEHLLENILSRRKEKYHITDLITQLPEFLEYIFKYYQASEYKDHFNQLLKEQAEKARVRMADENSPTYEEFKATVLYFSPHIEEKMREKLNEEKIAFLENINVEELSNLFRQGSQPLGVVPIPVWNYLAAPDRQEWGPVKTILDLAAHELMTLRYENEQTYEHQVPVPRPHPPEH